MFAVVYSHNGVDMVPAIASAPRARELAKKCVVQGCQQVKVVRATERHEGLYERYRDWATD